MHVVEPVTSAVPVTGEAAQEPYTTTTHRLAFVVGRVEPDLDALAATLERTATANGWEVVGRSDERVAAEGREVTLAFDRDLRTPAGDVRVQAISCGTDGAFVFREQDLRPSHLPPCTDQAVAAACAEVEHLAEAAVGLPVTIAVGDRQLTATTLLPDITLQHPRAAATMIEGFERAGWVWEDRSPCPSSLPMPSACLPIGPDDDEAPQVLRFRHDAARAVVDLATGRRTGHLSATITTPVR